MSNQINGSRRVRIHSLVNKYAYIHIDDALSLERNGVNAPKLRFYGCTYNGSNGRERGESHYLDLSDARVVLQDLADGRPVAFDSYKGYSVDDSWMSSVLSIKTNPNRGKVYLEIKVGPGKRMDTGIIKPAGRMKSAVSFGLSIHEARAMAMTILAHVRAFDNWRYMLHVPDTYTTGAAYQITDMSAQDDMDTTATIIDDDAPVYQYGDGTVITDPQVIAIFNLYKEDKNVVPDSGQVLKAWYEESKKE